MVGLVLGCSGYQFFSQAFHEWLGDIALLTFIIHNVLNKSWYQRLWKGRYTPIRYAYADGKCIMMSRVVFDFLDMHYLISIARRMHILGAYLGISLYGTHTGLHWHMCVTYWKKKNTIIPSYIVTLLACIIACYGVFSLIKRQFLTYLFLRSEFVFYELSGASYLFLF